MAEPIDEDKWGPVKVPEAVKKPLVKQILTEGIIDRDQYPDLWPEKLLVTVKWPNYEKD